jgi:hypothetical protein
MNAIASIKEKQILSSAQDDSTAGLFVRPRILILAELHGRKTGNATVFVGAYMRYAWLCS